MATRKLDETTHESPLLVAEGVCKDYSVRVLHGASLSVKAGEIHGLLGGNGAGKSTLCRILAGLDRPNAGVMRLQNRAYAPSNKQDAERRGVQIIQQELNLTPELTVAENLFLNRMPHLLGVIRQRRLESSARAALDRFDLQDVSPSDPLHTLGVGKRQMIAIAAALDRECRVLILDEPTAALSERESMTLFAWLDRLRHQGVGVVYISHRLDEVKQWCDRVTILRDGRNAATLPVKDLTARAMVAWMTGEEPADDARANAIRPAPQPAAALLEVVELTRRPWVRAVSFQVAAGECLGIAGLVGAGRTELLETIFGASRRFRFYPTGRTSANAVDESPCSGRSRIRLADRGSPEDRFAVTTGHPFQCNSQQHARKSSPTGA